MDERTPELLDRFRKGDARAYEILFKRYEQELLRYIRCHMDRRLRGEISEEDLLQDTHVKALRSIDRFEYRREMAFFFWLCSIARNLITDHYRRLQRQPVKVSLHRPPSGAMSTSRDLLATLKRPALSPLDELQIKDNLHILAVALETMIDSRRQAVILKYVEGHNNQEAAQILELSPGAFRVLVWRAMVDLRKQLDHLIETSRDAPAVPG